MKITAVLLGVFALGFALSVLMPGAPVAVPIALVVGVSVWLFVGQTSDKVEEKLRDEEY